MGECRFGLLCGDSCFKRPYTTMAPVTGYLNPKPCDLNPKPKPQDPKRATLSHKVQTLSFRLEFLKAEAPHSQDLRRTEGLGSPNCRPRQNPKFDHQNLPSDGILRV